jgi:hypothetical protein
MTGDLVGWGGISRRIATARPKHYPPKPYRLSTAIKLSS